MPFHLFWYGQMRRGYEPWIGDSFSELGINGNLGWGVVGEGFFCFCQKNKNGNLGWETLGDALTKLCLLITQVNKHMKPWSETLHNFIHQLNYQISIDDMSLLKITQWNLALRMTLYITIHMKSYPENDLTVHHS